MIVVREQSFNCLPHGTSDGQLLQRVCYFQLARTSASLDGKCNLMRIRAYRCVERSDSVSRMVGSWCRRMRCDEVRGPTGYPIHVLSLVTALPTVLLGAHPSRTFVLQQLTAPDITAYQISSKGVARRRSSSAILTSSFVLSLEEIYSSTVLDGVSADRTSSAQPATVVRLRTTWMSILASRRSSKEVSLNGHISKQFAGPRSW